MPAQHSPSGRGFRAVPTARHCCAAVAAARGVLPPTRGGDRLRPRCLAVGLPSPQARRHWNAPVSASWQFLAIQGGELVHGRGDDVWTQLIMECFCSALPSKAQYCNVCETRQQWQACVGLYNARPAVTAVAPAASCFRCRAAQTRHRLPPSWARWRRWWCAPQAAETRRRWPMREGEGLSTQQRAKRKTGV